MLADDWTVLRGKLFYFMVENKQFEMQSNYGKNTPAGFNLGESSNADTSKFHFWEQRHVEMLDISHSFLPPIVPAFPMFHSISTY